MAVELLRLPAGDQHIAALEYEPRRPRGVSIVAAHGYSSSKQNLDGLCSFLALQGFRVVSIDFPGHKLGASGGRLRDFDDLIAALGAAVTYLRRENADPIYALGHSMGAMTALRVCARDATLSGAVSITTGYKRMRVLDAIESRGTVDLRAAYVDGASLPEIASAAAADIDATLAALAGRPVLYIAAERDGMVSPSSVEELFDRAPEPKTFALVASDHTNAADASRSSVLGWLNALHPRDAPA